MTDTRDAQGAQDKSDVVTTFKQRDAWSRIVARHPLVKLMHRHVLGALARCARLDDDGKIIFKVTYDDLGEASDCTKRTAIRALAAGEEIGIVRKIKKSDGRVSNEFELLFPNDDSDDGSNGDKMEVPTVTNILDLDRPNGDKSDLSTVTNQANADNPNGDTAVTVLRLRVQEEESKKESKARAALRAALCRCLSTES